MHKKGNFNALGAFGWTLITFALLVGLGMLMLQQFALAATYCPSTFPTWNQTTYMCQNSTGQQINGNTTATNTLTAITAYLGTSNGGLC